MVIADYPTSTTDNMRVPLRRVQALYEISEQLMQAKTIDQVFQMAAYGLVEQAHYLTSWMTSFDQKANTLQGRSGHGTAISQELIEAIVPLNVPSVLAETVETRQVMIVEDAVELADREGWGDIAREIQMQSVIYLPFGNTSEVLGLMAVGVAHGMNVEEEQTLLGLFATQLTTALLKVKYDHERAEQIAALEEAAQTHDRLLQTVRDLSTPAIPIYDGILAIPLVGNIDSGRANQVMETVLTSIQRVHAAVVILDVTGVPIIDTGVANHLVQVTQAAQLLGAKCLLVGIKPEVAQTLVQLGVDLSSIATRSDLQAGMEFALNQRGLRIVQSRN